MTQLNLLIEELVPALEGKAVKVVRFIGQLDSSNVEESKKIVEDVIGDKKMNLFLIFDFSKLEYLNSRAIGCLVECYQTISGGGGKILIASPTENVADVIKVVGINKVIPMYQSVEAAVSDLKKGV